jgi:hypothetical protein
LLVRFYFDRLPDAPRHVATLEFVRREPGTSQEPILGG